MLAVARAGAVLLAAALSAQPLPTLKAIPAPQALIAARALTKSDPAAAYTLAENARRELLQVPAGRDRDLQLASALCISGEAKLRLDQATQAELAVRAGLDILSRIGPGWKLQADCLMSRAGVRAVRGDVGGALADYFAAFDGYNRVRDFREQSAAMLNVASIYIDAADYGRALSYLARASDLYSGEVLLDLANANNSANALDQLGRFADAEKAYGRALALAGRIEDPLMTARILDNLAQCQRRQGSYGRALSTVEQGIALSRNARAATWRPFLIATAARIRLDIGELDRAASLIRQAIALSRGHADSPTYADMHETAYLIFKQQGLTGDALAHLEMLQRLQAETRTAVVSANASLMSARFDFATQNARIANLKQGQLQRDVALEKLHGRQRSTVLGALLGVLLVVALALALYLRASRRAARRLTQANDELGRTNAELTAALSAKADFLAMTSHEIRTPLNAILGITEVMLAVSKLPDEVSERMRLVQSAGETMRELVDDLLDLAKMDSGNIELTDDAFSPSDLLQQMAIFWSSVASRKKIALETVLKELPPFVLGDEKRVRQIVSNLLSNAVKFTPRGEVVLSASVATGQSGPRLLIFVRDTGIGIALFDQNRIFDHFTQVDSGVTREYSGTGLGLSICRRLARAMGGDVTVQSELAQGSTFTLDIPLRRPHGTPVDQGSGSTAHDRATWVALIMRNPIERAMLKTLLAGSGYEVEAFDNASHTDIVQLSTFGVIVCASEDVQDYAMMVYEESVIGRRSGKYQALLVVSGGGRVAEVESVPGHVVRHVPRSSSKERWMEAVRTSVLEVEAIDLAQSRAP